MTNWIPLQAIGLSAVDAGPKVTAFRSPFDIPTALRVTHDAALTRLKVEFRYLGSDERTREERIAGAVCHLGIHSGRVYAIDLDLTIEAAVALRRALKSLEQQHRRSARNYEAAGQAVAAHQELLVAAR
jgi:hypothetical protein